MAQAMKRADAGVLEVNSDFGEGDFARLRTAAEIAGRPLSVLLVQVDKAPDLWRETLDQVVRVEDSPDMLRTLKETFNYDPAETADQAAAANASNASSVWIFWRASVTTRRTP